MYIIKLKKNGNFFFNIYNKYRNAASSFKDILC